MEVRGQPAEVGSLLPWCLSSGSNSSCQMCHGGKLLYPLGCLTGSILEHFPVTSPQKETGTHFSCQTPHPVTPKLRVTANLLGLCRVACLDKFHKTGSVHGLCAWLSHVVVLWCVAGAYCMAFWHAACALTISECWCCAYHRHLWVAALTLLFCLVRMDVFTSGGAPTGWVAGPDGEIMFNHLNIG